MRAARAARLFFPQSTNQVIVFWRRRSRCRRPSLIKLPIVLRGRQRVRVLPFLSTRSSKIYAHKPKACAQYGNLVLQPEGRGCCYADRVVPLSLFMIFCGDITPKYPSLRPSSLLRSRSSRSHSTLSVPTQLLQSVL